MRERGFAQSRRAVEQNVVERLAALLGCRYKNAQVFDDARLTGKVV